MPRKIPATVVTGFLGAGKTTLIRHLLQNAEGRRIALVINEFGDLGVDGEILKGCGDEVCAEGDMIELSNGCICCTVADEFMPTMKALIERDAKPDHIVIETSGLALPQPLIRAFNWPEIRTSVTVDGVITVVDGAAIAEGRFADDEAALERQRDADDTLDHATPVAELFEDQLACADMILVNKADLLDQPQVAAVTARLAAGARAGVRVIETHHGRIQPGVLLGLGVGAEGDLDARAEVHHQHHDDNDVDPDAHGHDEFETFIVDLPEIDDVGGLTQRLADAARCHDILRVKGFVAVAGKPMRMVLQAVGPRVDHYFDRPFAAAELRRTRLVVIAEHGIDRAEVARALHG